ncbi:single-stranded DNA-binding protein [Salipiger sp. 1_MG-2023]|uniref:single-stranded DNA-binding protein n=1 Tax=Salipiger sp. 1_MG-2023 TaxID=3062665 RepID=UPI0026E216E1|nr:single-stranded DNA-binding protein [Salipiger sp. 1_MG-2023]MDO6587356.1 single-stranded DNA-binding protein [Salipiger sp. 1_MG-2023]
MQTLTIAGNVGKDAVLRRTNNGDPVLNFSLAVDNGKDRDGNRRDSTWFDCSIWGKRAESLERHISKGTKLVLRGRPTSRAHDGKAYLGINVDDLTFMGGGSDGGSRGGDSYGGGQGNGYGAGGRPGGGNRDLDDEILFNAEGRI